MEEQIHVNDVHIKAAKNLSNLIIPLESKTWKIDLFLIVWLKQIIILNALPYNENVHDWRESRTAGAGNAKLYIKYS